MSMVKKIVVWTAVMAAVATALARIPSVRPSSSARRQPMTVRGAVLQQDADLRKQLPISDVVVSTSDGSAAGEFKSDSAGFFSVTLRPGVKAGQPITIRFRHPDYQSLELKAAVGNGIYVARMVPLHRESESDAGVPEVGVGNILVRYSLTTTASVNVGNAVKAFQVVNTGNVPCNKQSPCSPDGRWKAGIGSTSIDADDTKEFRNARVACIAGPCPFTYVESDGFSRGGPHIGVSVRNWSDTTTFLLQADVFRTQVNDAIHESYPVIVGTELNFTLPPAAEGPSIEAKINGATIIFPLGPNAYLSWADCNVRVDRDETKVYWCALKPGYRFAAEK